MTKYVFQPQAPVTVPWRAVMSSFRYVAFTAWVATMPPMPVKWALIPTANRRSSFVNQRTLSSR